MTGAAAALTATLTLAPNGPGEWAIVISLENETAAPIGTQLVEPFIPARVEVTVGGHPLTVLQPALDIPVQTVPLTIAPGEHKRLSSPVRLRFGATGSGDDPFVWTIESAPTTVRVTAEISLAGLAPLRAEATLAAAVPAAP